MNIITEAKAELGIAGLKKLAQVLTGHHNNREVAQEFGLTLFQVTTLNKIIPDLCHEVLKEDRKPCPIYQLVKRTA